MNMIIDGHAHACGEYYDYDSIIRVLDENNTDRVVLCPGEVNSRKNYGLPLISERFPKKDIMFAVNRVIGFVTKMTGAAKHVDEQNAYVYDLSQMSSGRIIQSYWINPLDQDCLSKLEDDHKAYGFKLIKLHQCWHPFDMVCENVGKILTWALGHHMPVFIHLSTREQVDAFIQISNDHRDNTFIVAHLIGFEAIHENSKNPNLYYEISPPQLIDEERLKKAINQVGVNRVILGSDTPYGKQNLQMNLNRIDSFDINESEKNLIKGENMYRLLFPDEIMVNY
jgi:hypothetical protein